MDLKTTSIGSTVLNLRILPVWLLLIEAGFLLLIAMEEYLAAFIIIAGLLSLAFIFNSAENALILLPFFLFLPFEIPGLGGIQFSEIGTFLVLLSCVISLLLTQSDLEFQTPAIAPIILILIAYCLSVTNARYVMASVKDILKFIEAFLIILVFTANFVTQKRTILAIFRVFILSGLLASVIGLVRYFSGMDSRVFGLLGGDFGAFLGISILMVISILMFSSHKIEKVLMLVIFPVMLSTMVLSQSRAWLFGLFLALFFMFIHFRKEKMFFRLISITAVAGLVTFFLIYGDFFSGSQGNLLTQGASIAFQSGLGEGEVIGRYISVLMRIFIWIHCFFIYLQNPILGFGVGNLRIRNYFTGELGAPGQAGVGYVDNHWLNILYETGIAGIVGWLWLAIVVYKSCKHLIRMSPDPEWKQISLVLSGSFIILLVGSMFWVLNVVHEMNALIPFLFGLVFASLRMVQKSH